MPLSIEVPDKILKKVNEQIGEEEIERFLLECLDVGLSAVNQASLGMDFSVVEKGFDVLPIHRWTSHNIAELKGDKTKINWLRIGFKNNNFYVKKQGHAIARSEKQWVQ